MNQTPYSEVFATELRKFPPSVCLCGNETGTRNNFQIIPTTSKLKWPNQYVKARKGEGGGSKEMEWRRGQESMKGQQLTVAPLGLKRNQLRPRMTEKKGMQAASKHFHALQTFNKII